MFDNDNNDHPVYDNSNHQRDAPSWVLIIFIGVFLANIATLTVIKLYLDYEAKQLGEVLKQQALNLNESMRKKHLQIEESKRQQQIEIQKQLKQAQSEAANRKIQLKKKNDLCQFWIKEVAQNNSIRNQELKRRACSR